MKPIVTLDHDEAITEASAFLSTLTHSLPRKVLVITYPQNLSKAINDLYSRSFRQHFHILVQGFDGKAEVITENGENFYIKDHPDHLKAITHSVQLILFRKKENSSLKAKDEPSAPK